MFTVTLSLGYLHIINILYLLNSFKQNMGVCYMLEKAVKLCQRLT